MCTPAFYVIFFISADMLSRIAGTAQEDEILVLDTSNPSFSADPVETTKEPSTSAELLMNNYRNENFLQISVRMKVN